MADVREILSEEQRAFIARGYDDEEMLRLARGSSAGYAPAVEWNEYILGQFYTPEGVESGLPARDRERTLIGLLTGVRADGLFLAIHIYWGLVVPDALSVDEIARTMLLAGSYTGIDAFNGGLGVLQKTLTVLAQLALEDAPPTPTAVVGALAAAGL